MKILISFIIISMMTSTIYAATWHNYTTGKDEELELIPGAETMRKYIIQDNDIQNLYTYYLMMNTRNPLNAYIEILKLQILIRADQIKKESESKQITLMCSSLGTGKDGCYLYFATEEGPIGGAMNFSCSRNLACEEEK